MTSQERPPGAKTETGTKPAPVGLPRRLAVMLYDGMLLFAVLFAATLIVMPLTRGHAIAPNNSLYTLYLIAVSYLYFGWFWTHGGQTLGMRAWGVRLLGRSAAAVTWKECLVRFVAAVISWIPLGLGFIWAGIDREKRAWHDAISGTRLVHEPPAARRQPS